MAMSKLKLVDDKYMDDLEDKLRLIALYLLSLVLGVMCTFLLWYSITIAHYINSVTFNGFFTISVLFSIAIFVAINMRKFMDEV